MPRLPIAVTMRPGKSLKNPTTPSISPEILFLAVSKAEVIFVQTPLAVVSRVLKAPPRVLSRKVTTVLNIPSMVPQAVEIAPDIPSQTLPTAVFRVSQAVVNVVLKKVIMVLNTLSMAVQVADMVAGLVLDGYKTGKPELWSVLKKKMILEAV